jgi:hypothetical protein
MLRSLRCLVLLAALPVFARHVAFVDNSRPTGGDGSAANPFSSIALARRADVIYVLQTDKPYVESVFLQKGQMLIGSAYGLDAVRAELHLDDNTPAAPAQQGTGPLIHGTISVAGDNVVAGCTMIVDRGGAGITSAAGEGALSLRGMLFQTTQRGFAIYLQGHLGTVSIIGGGVQATEEGSGVAIAGGDGDLTVERFPLSGSFASALRIGDRTRGAITFRNGSSIRTDDATDDAISISNMPTAAPVTFTDRIQIRGRRRGFVAAKVAKLAVRGGDSWLITSGAAALDLRDVGADITFDAVSAENAAEGLVADKVRGKLEVTGREHEAGSGGTIRAAKNYGVRIVQSSNVRLANLTIAASGSKGTVKGAKCAGGFDVTSVVPCNAALYLRHLETASFENLVVDGGGAMGLNASNIRDVKFENVDIHGAGDESFEAGVLLQELGDGVHFIRSSFTDNAGSEVTIEQRFKPGHLTFDRCTFAAPVRPTIAPHLLDAHVLGNGRLDLEIHNAELRDNAGTAMEAAASGSATLFLTITDSTGQHLGTGGIVLRAGESAQAALALTRVRMTAPAAASLVEVTAEGSSSACVDLAANTLSGGGPAIRLTAAPPAALHAVSGAASGAVLAEALAAANDGATALIHVAPDALTVVRSCR